MSKQQTTVFNACELFCFAGKDGIRPSNRVCREKASARNRHQGEEPLERPVSGTPPGFQAAPAGHHGRGAPPTHRHEFQRVCWFPDRTPQQGAHCLTGAEIFLIPLTLCCIYHKLDIHNMIKTERLFVVYFL